MDVNASIGRSIRRLFRLNQRYSMGRMEHPELNQSELQLLRHVGFHGETSQRHLAETMGVDKAMISRILKSLEEKGYLIRREDEKDARSKLITALPPAREIHLEGKGYSERFFDSITKEFSEEELALLDSLLGRMVEKARELTSSGKENAQ